MFKFVQFDKERIAHARSRRLDAYSGRKPDRTVFSYTPTAPVSKGWINNCPYSFSEMLTDPLKCVQGQLMGFAHQCENFPDSDWTPVYQTFMYGEGFIPSLLGAPQMDGGENPPFQNGRILTNLNALDTLPAHIDEKKGYGPCAREALLRMVDATGGYVPIAILDHQSPYGMATKLMDNESLMLAMYDEPELVHKLMAYCTDKIIETVDLVTSWVGKENLCLNPTLGIAQEGGIILWDDYVSVITPQLYIEFCKPYNDRLYARYGRGHLHTCGPYFPHFIDAVLSVDPVSIDLGILRGMSRTREDMLQLMRVAHEHKVLVCGGVTAIETSVFEKRGIVEPDANFLHAMTQYGNLMLAESGSVQRGKQLAHWLFGA